MKEMKFSVIITTYNKLQFLIECIESVYVQTYQEPFQLIIVNDASTDGTKEYLDHELPLPPHHIELTVLHNKKNLGLQKTFNIGAYYAEGEWICVLDHDDKLLPNCLVDVEKFIDENDKDDKLGMVYTNIIQDGKERKYPDFIPGRIQSCFGTGNLNVYKRKAFEDVNGWRINLDYGADTAIVVDMIENDWRVVHFDKAVYWNRLHDEQYTQKYVADGGNPRDAHNWIVNRTLALRPELWIDARENVLFGGFIKHWKSEVLAMRPYCNGIGVDLGCGRHKRYPFAIGVDTDRGGGKVPEIVCDIEKEELPFMDRSLDYIVSGHVVESLQNPLDCIRKWSKKLKVGGYLLLVIPDTSLEHVPHIGGKKTNPTHKWDFTPKKFKEEIADKIGERMVLFQIDTLGNSWSFEAFFRRVK